MTDVHPLAPYAYQLEYRDGRTLAWDSPGGPWGEREAPVEGLTWVRLVVARIGVVSYAIAESAVPVASLYLRMRGRVILGFGGLPEHRRRYCVGVLGIDGRLRGIRVGELGQIARYEGDPTNW